MVITCRHIQLFSIFVMVGVILLGRGSAVAQTAGDGSLALAEDGTTACQIVRPAEPSEIDQYAIEQLHDYLQQITGAEYAVVGPDAVQDDGKYIFVGMSAPAKMRLGADDPVAGLEMQEHVARSKGGDIFLYGEGMHGNLSAAFEFLENSLGWRWFSILEEPVIPDTPTVVLDPFHRKKGYAYKYRELQLQFGNDCYYQHGINMGWTRAGRGSPYISVLPTTRFTHSTFAYIPPTPKYKLADAFEWQDKKNYFETNPEFYTLSQDGERIPNKQLCFSNSVLREELTRNVMHDIAYHKEEKGWDRFYVSIGANDTPGNFCYCKPCQALERKYQTVGGPMLDYVIELAGVLQDRHPDVMVKTSAYRRSQTQKPPRLADRDMLPENIILSFAPIEDAYLADWWTHQGTEEQETFHDLLGWADMTHHLWAWIYPSPWGSRVPVGNIERTINNIRLMSYAGVEGLFTDHGHSLTFRKNFAELHRYVLLKLMKDPHQDADRLIEEFTDAHYGKAGAMMRKYMDELEAGRKAMTPPKDISYKARYFDDEVFPYLTPENIHRWQQYFDQMVEMTADQPDKQLNVRTVRRELDFATLWRWHDLQDAHPDYYDDHQKFAQRIHDTDDELVEDNGRVRKLGNKFVDEFVLKIEAGDKDGALPEALAHIDESRIQQVVPIRHRNGPRYESDPEAAFGYTAAVDRPGDLPFPFGFHQMNTGERIHSIHLEADQITPGEYRLYEIGPVELTQKSWVYLGRSWQTHIDLGRLFYSPESDNLWTLYASLKFVGERYGGEGEQSGVYCDRVILVKKQPDTEGQ